MCEEVKDMKRKIISIFLCILLIGIIIPYAVMAVKIDTENNIIKNNSPPNAPTITAPEQVKRGKAFDVKVVTTDPEGDDVYYRFEINGVYHNWNGPFPSSLEHDQKMSVIIPPGSYTLGAQAKDSYDAESEWSYLEISVIKSDNIAITWQFLNFLQNIMDRFPLFARLLRL
jgi:hypothetical protein